MTKNLDSSFYLPHAGRDDDPERTQGGDSLPLLVGLVVDAIHAADGKMFLDIHVDDELRECIECDLRSQLAHLKERKAVEEVIRNVFEIHREREEEAARDDVNIGLYAAIRSLPNVKAQGIDTPPNTQPTRRMSGPT